MLTSVKMVSEASYQIQVTSASVLNGNGSAVVVVFKNGTLKNMETSYVTLKPAQVC